MIWVLAGMLSVLVAGILALPLIRGRAAVDDRAAFDLQVYKDQLRELDRDASRGLIDEAEAKAARLEIERRILAADDERQTVKPAGRGARPVLAAFVAAVPVAALVFYGMTGSPDVPDHPFAQRGLPETKTAAAPADHPAADTGAGGQAGSMEAMVEKLAQRMAAQPGDVDGWLLLARSYVALERFAEAAEAYERALPLAPDAPQFLADYGEVLVMANAGTVTPGARDAFARALAQDAANPKARFFLGIEKAQQGDVAGALQDWVDLVTIGPPRAPWIPAVRDQIERAAQEIGVAPADLAPSAEALAIAARVPEMPADGAAPAQPGPSAADIEAAQEMSAEDRRAMIRSMVQRLADRLEENPDDAEGWKRLERAYRVLGETEKADEAARRGAEAAQ